MFFSRTTRSCRLSFAAAIALLACPALARAQAVDWPWSGEFAIGWDKSVSGNINSGGIGRINNQDVVILKNPYEDVYGTGLHMKFGGGYMVDPVTELRATFTFQSLDADLTEMGDIGASQLLRPVRRLSELRHRRRVPALRVRDRPRVPAVRRRHDRPRRSSTRPTSSSSRRRPTSPAMPPISTTRTAAFTLGGNVGVLWQLSDRVGVFGQLGLRWVSDVRGGRARGHRARDDQRQELALDDAAHLRPARPVLRGD